jgi:hypothetical protein
MRRRHLFGAALLAAIPTFALAQQDVPESHIVPPDAQSGVYTTHKEQPLLPWKKQPAPPISSPALNPGPIPFGHAAPEVSQPVPNGPRTMQAAPVPDVGSVEVMEPAAPAAAVPEVNPAAENPAVPTEETSPIFSTTDVPRPLKIVVRALNKVTGRSEKFELRPGEQVTFGKLDIRAVTCEASTPESQRDYAGLIELAEHVPGQARPKPLFRGWMYASSPSVVSLEHPIYDVTMVECVSAESPKPEAKKDEKKEEKAKPAPKPAAANDAGDNAAED